MWSQISPTELRLEFRSTRYNTKENHSDCSGVAQHALVLGSSGYVQPNPTEPAQYAQPVDSHSIRSLTEI